MSSFLVSNKENWGDRQYLGVVDAAITAGCCKEASCDSNLYTLNAVECSGATEKHEEETMSSSHPCRRFTHSFYASLDAVQKKEGRKEGSIHRLLNYEPFDELPKEVHQAQK